ncbi:MAG TPA: GNAT family N-acetyltransferase [Candidatus Baltobacteraceae bacterium]|nr:GNAT family N-acetyltransferase [Candidatus Baltobacteraceae bacterium]
MSLEVVRLQPPALESFFREHEREALRAFYEFPVVWHEQSYGFAALEDERMLGAGVVRIAASLGHVDRVIVAQERRRGGLGRALLDAMAEVANYYNCHKMTAMVPHLRGAQRFFEACGYGVEAVLPQHTFKLDMAMMRKYLL